MKQSCRVAIHDVVIILGADHRAEFIEVFLIQRSVTGLVMQIGIGTVDGIVGAEQELTAPPSLDRFEGAFDRHPCRITVQVIRFAEQLDRLAVIGAQIHMHHHKADIGMLERGIVQMDGTRLLAAAGVRNDRQMIPSRDLIHRLGTGIIGRDT